MDVTYLHLPAGTEPPTMAVAAPYMAVLILDQATSEEWQSKVSDWLVSGGCLYMMAWGPNASSWDDSVDWASVEAHTGDIPAEKSVMTTWHDDEPLAETLWFAGNAAVHPTTPLSRTLIIDVAEKSRGTEILAAYQEAQKQTF